MEMELKPLRERERSKARRRGNRRDEKNQEEMGKIKK